MGTVVRIRRRNSSGRWWFASGPSAQHTMSEESNAIVGVRIAEVAFVLSARVDLHGMYG